MMESEILNKTFTKEEKLYLDSVLREKEIIKYTELFEDLEKYVNEVILQYLYPKDLIKLYNNNRDYCKTISNIVFDGENFGFSKNYTNSEKDSDSDDGTKRKIPPIKEISTNIPLYDLNLPYSKSIDDCRKLSVIIADFPTNIINNIINKATDYLEARYNACNFLREYTLQLYYNEFNYFYNINTWGELYNINKDWYFLVYNKFKDSLKYLSLTETEIMENDLKRSIESLKNLIEYGIFDDK